MAGAPTVPARSSEPVRASTSRRSILRAAAGVAAAVLVRPQPTRASVPVIKIGHVSPQTGPQAHFAEGQSWVLEGMRRYLGKGLRIGDRIYSVQIIAKDSQTSVSRASEVASELILKDQVDLITAASGSITCNPVANQAELNDVPCITTDNPWEAYYYGRDPPERGFDWTYHFFWGIDQVLAAFIDLWRSASTNKVVGILFNTEQDDSAWRAAFIPAIKRAGFSIVDPGQFPAFGNDFTPQINAFRQAKVEIITGNMYTPDFTTFYTQCAQQGYQPKVITLGKAFLFPSDVASLGARGVGVTSEVWWTPTHPYASSLTGDTYGKLAADYEAATGRHWSQPIPFKHALFEVVIDVLKRTRDPKDPTSIQAAIRSTNLQTIVGPVRWSGRPVRNVCTTPVVVGQWQKHGDRLDIAVVAHGASPDVPVTSKLLPLS